MEGRDKKLKERSTWQRGEWTIVGVENGKHNHISYERMNERSVIISAATEETTGIYETAPTTPRFGERSETCNQIKRDGMTSWPYNAHLEEGAGNAEGDDIYETEITLEELMDYIVEDLDLPIWIKRNIQKLLLKVLVEKEGIKVTELSQD